MPIRKGQMRLKSISGSFRPETVNEEERTVEVVFTTGEGGKRYDWYEGVEYIEELDVTDASIRTGRLDKGLSVLDSHNTYGGIDNVFGITEGYRIENGEMIGTVRFASDEKSDERFRKVADGILRHVSLGYKVHKYFKSRGADDKLDTYRAVDWEPTELSFVPVSFETTNGVRSEQRENEPTFAVEIEEETMNKDQLVRLAFLQGLENRTAEQTAEMNTLLQLQRMYADDVQSRTEVPAPAAPAAVVTPEVQRTEVAPAPTAPAAVAPQVNADEIRQQAAADSAEMFTACRNVGLSTEYAERAIADGKSLEVFRAELITELGNRDSEFIIPNTGVELNSDGRSDNRAAQIDAAVAAIQYRNGDNVELNDTIRGFTGMRLLDMARHFAGQGNELGYSPMKVAKRAFHTNSDFPLILENVMNKSLNRGYTETPQTFRDLGTRTTHNDFRDRKTYTLGDAPNLLPLGEHGEYKAGTFSESGEQYGLATYARKIGFTREMLINDDMNALSNVPTMFGAASSRLESDVVWGLLLNYDFFTNSANNILMSDQKALFHADHGNLLEAGSALSETALSNLRLLGRNMKTLDGNYMNVTYKTLVMGGDLETTAEKLLQNNFVAAKSADTNSFLNKLDFRIEPRVAAVSATQYLAFAKSIEIDTFEYAYLAGEEEMMVDVVNSIDVDGMMVRVRKDFGAGLKDYRGMAKATGAA